MARVDVSLEMCYSATEAKSQGGPHSAKRVFVLSGC